MSVALVLASSNAAAIGFGKPSTSAILGQPLNFTVVLRQGQDEFIDAECVTADVLIGDSKVPPQKLRYSVEGPANAPDRVLRITSNVIVDEPIITVNVQVGCPPTLNRAFTALADPPLLQLPTQVAAAASRPASAVASSATAVRVRPPRRAPEPRPADAGSATPPPARRGEAGIASESRVTAPTAAAAPRPNAPAVTTTVRRGDVAAGDRLKLDANPAPRRSARAPGAAASVPAIVSPGAIVAAGSAPVSIPAVSASSVPPSAPSPVATAASAALDKSASLPAGLPVPSVAASVPLTPEAERLRVLEESLTKLRSDAAAQATELATLRARVQRSETERYANPVTYTLGVIAALLAGALGMMLFRRTRERDASWFANAMQDPGLASIPAPPIPPSPVDSQYGDVGDDTLAATQQHTRAEDPRSTVVLDDARFASAPPAPNLLAPETQPALTEQRREVSVEELIDLEQQAEFFVVLGQDEAAIDLLMSHLRNTGGISPLPYLKLLEIYHRRGDREAYERMRDRFNRRFNAYAPEWGEDLSHGRSLEDYPEIMRALEAMWPTPQRAMVELETLLFRRDAGETFDVPAYGEVLFLYSMARDLSEHEISMTTQPTVEMDNVDFLLPLDDDPNASGGSLYRPMISTIPMESNPAIEKPLTLDFDISKFDDPFKKP